MSLQEIKLNSEITKLKFYIENLNIHFKNKKLSIDLFTKIYKAAKSDILGFYSSISKEQIVELVEICIAIPELIKLCDELLKFYFEFDPAKNGYFIRALLVKAQIESYYIEELNVKAEELMIELKKIINYIIRAVEIISKPENKVKYSFLMYNSSIVCYNILKKHFRVNWSKNFWEILERISNFLEESNDVDYNWRIRLLLRLVTCYLDAEKKQEASKALDKITDIIKKKGECDFMEELFRLRIHYSRDNQGALGNLKKEADAMGDSKGLKFLFTPQAIKSNVYNDGNIEKEVQTFISSIYPDFYKAISDINFRIKIDTPKADALAEAAFNLYLNFKNNVKVQAIISQLIQFLNRCRTNTMQGKLFIENLKTVLSLTKFEEESKINQTSESELIEQRILMRNQALNSLERNLSGCLKIMNLDLINDTCMLIFNTAIPFFKPSLRKNINKSFLSVVEALEQTESNESYLRVCFHYELAKSYMEEDLLQEAKNQLTKALLLDYSIPQNKISPLPKPTDNVNLKYLQRNLDQYINYLQRLISVRLDIYSEKTDPIEILIYEEENLKSAKNSTIKREILSKCCEIMKNYKVKEFDENDFRKPSDKNYGKDLVEEELNDIKQQYQMQVLEDKKHFALIASSYMKQAVESGNFNIALEMNDLLNKKNLLEIEFSPKYDVEQVIALSQMHAYASACYENFLSDEGIEIGSQEIINYLDRDKKYEDIEKTKFEEWKEKFVYHLSLANRLAVSVFQNWLVFNIAIQLWNAYLPIIRSLNSVSLVYEGVVELLGDVFEALNSAIISMEAINAEVIDSEFFLKTDVFVNLTAFYAKILEKKGRADESIRVCDVMLGRKLSSNSRKVFDQLKSRALRTLAGDGGKKGGTAKPNQAQGKIKKDLGVGFIPSNDQLALSECFATLENAILTTDEKIKYDTLKKGFDLLKATKLNQNDDNTIELASELWYKYGVQFFSLRNYICYKLGVFCGESCVKPFDKIDLKTLKKQYNNNEVELRDVNTGVLLKKKTNFDDDPKYRVLKWYSVGFLLYGDSLSALVNPEKQERPSQIQLYFLALNKYIISCEIAEQCKQHYVIHQSAKAFYNVVTNLIDQPQSRENLVELFVRIHKIFVRNRVAVLYSDPDFLLLFYSMFSQCIVEVKDWELGESVISDALKMLHTSKHHFLLEYKLHFYSKLGKNFYQHLQAADDKDPVSKAKLYIKLARISESYEEQFNSYNKAIEILKNDQNVLAVDYMIELGSWLYKNSNLLSLKLKKRNDGNMINNNTQNSSFTISTSAPNNQNYIQEVEDQFLQAVDMILEIEPVFDDDEDLEEDNVTMQTKKSGASRLSRMSKMSKIKSDKSKSKLTRNKSQKSKLTSKTRNYNTQSAQTKSVFSKINQYDPYPLFINVSHYQLLFNIHIQLAIVNPKKEIDYLLDAFFFLTKMIDISFKTLNCLDFFERSKEDISKMNLDIENPIVSLVNYYFTSKELVVPQVFFPPDSITAYSTYEFPSFFIKKIKEFNESCFFSASAFHNTNLFLNNLLFLIDKFSNEYYFHTQLYLILKVGVLFCDNIIENSILKDSMSLKLLRLNHSLLNMDIVLYDKNYTQYLNLIGGAPGKNKEQDTITNEKDKNKDKDKDKDKDVSNNFKPTIQQLSNTAVIKEREYLRKFDILLSQDENFLISKEKNLEVVLVNNNPIHCQWLEYAKELFIFGYIPYCKEYINEILFHCRVLKDKDCYIKASIVLVKIHFIEENFKLAFALITRLQQILMYLETSFTLFEIVYYSLCTLHKYPELLKYINKFLENIDFISVSEKKGLYNNYKTSTDSLNYFKCCLLIAKSNVHFLLLKYSADSNSIENKSMASSNKLSSVKMNPNLKGSMMKVLPSTMSVNYTRKGEDDVVNMNTNTLKNNPYFNENNNDFTSLFYTFNTTISVCLDLYNNIPHQQRIQEVLLLLDLVKSAITVVIEHPEFIYINNEELQLAIQLFELSCNYLTKCRRFLTDLQSLIPGRIEEKPFNLPIYRLLGVIKVSYAQINNYIGEFKAKVKRLYREAVDSENREKHLDLNSEILDYINSLTHELEEMEEEKTKNNNNNVNGNKGNSNDPYSVENNKPKKDNMNRYEKSISVLISVEIILPDYISEYIPFLVERINSYRLQAMNSKELIQLWNKETLNKIKELEVIREKENADKQIKDKKDKKNESENETREYLHIDPSAYTLKEFHQKAMNLVYLFDKNKIQSGLINANYEYAIKAFEPMIKFYNNIIELSGYLNIKYTVNSLFEYQNYKVKKYLSQLVDKYLSTESREWSHLVSYKYCRNHFQFNSNISTLSLHDNLNTALNSFNKIPFLNNLISCYKEDEFIAMTNPNSSYFTFQMNDDRSILYIGFFYFDSEKKAVEHYVRRIAIKPEINSHLDDLYLVIKNIKHTLIKTSFVTKDNLREVQNDFNEQVKNILAFIEDVFNSVWRELELIINPEIKEDTLNNLVDKKKKPEPTKKDKGGNVGVNLGNTKLPNSGIESLHLFIDYRFIDLPFEFISCFKNIPIKANDLSLNCLLNRAKNNNSTFNSNISTEKLSYFIDYPELAKIQELEKHEKEYLEKEKTMTNNNKMSRGKTSKKVFNPSAGAISSEIARMDPGKLLEKLNIQTGKNMEIRVEGVYSKERLPSVGELQRLFSNNHLFMSQTSLLYQFPPSSTLSLSSISQKNKIIFMFDRLTTLKDYVNQKSLISNNFSFQNQPLELIGLLTLQGSSSIVIPKWSIDFSEATEIIQDIINENQKGYNVCFGLNKYRSPKNPREMFETNDDDNKKKGKDKDKKKDEIDVDDTVNKGLFINKLELFSYGISLWGLSNVKL